MILWKIFFYLVVGNKAELFSAIFLVTMPRRVILTIPMQITLMIIISVIVLVTAILWALHGKTIVYRLPSHFFKNSHISNPSKLFIGEDKINQVLSNDSEDKWHRF